MYCDTKCHEIVAIFTEGCMGGEGGKTLNVWQEETVGHNTVTPMYLIYATKSLKEMQLNSS